MSLPHSITVEGDYSVEVGYKEVDITGNVDIEPEDVLNELDVEDVLEFYEAEGNALDLEFTLKNSSTDEIIAVLKDERDRGAFADVNVEKIIKELQV